FDDTDNRVIFYFTANFYIRVTLGTWFAIKRTNHWRNDLIIIVTSLFGGFFFLFFGWFSLLHFWLSRRCFLDWFGNFRLRNNWGVDSWWWCDYDRVGVILC